MGSVVEKAVRDKEAATAKLQVAEMKLLRFARQRKTHLQKVSRKLALEEEVKGKSDNAKDRVNRRMCLILAENARLLEDLEMMHDALLEEERRSKESQAQMEKLRRLVVDPDPEVDFGA